MGRAACRQRSACYWVGIIARTGGGSARSSPGSRESDCGAVECRDCDPTKVYGQTKGCTACCAKNSIRAATRPRHFFLLDPPPSWRSDEPRRSVGLRFPVDHSVQVERRQKEGPDACLSSIGGSLARPWWRRPRAGIFEPTPKSDG